jgi:hypothetical protein
MKLNVGDIDRIARIVAGVALIGLTLTNLIGLWGWIGVVPLATGMFTFCPVYALIGVNTSGEGARFNRPGNPVQTP